MENGWDRCKSGWDRYESGCMGPLDGKAVETAVKAVETADGFLIWKAVGTALRKRLPGPLVGESG